MDLRRHKGQNSGEQKGRVIEGPQTFVKAVALDRLARLAKEDRKLLPVVRRTLPYSKLDQQSASGPG
jgi:hypothetical protein